MKSINTKIGVGWKQKREHWVYNEQGYLAMHGGGGGNMNVLKEIILMFYDNKIPKG